MRLNEWLAAAPSDVPQSVLKHIRANVDPVEIARSICAERGVQVQLVLDGYGSKEVCEAREDCCFELWRVGYTLKEIAEAIGFAGHSGVKRVLGRRKLRAVASERKAAE